MIEAKIVTTRVCEAIGRADSPETLEAIWRANVEHASWYGDAREHLVCFGCDTRFNVSQMFLISVGTLNETPAHPREILRPIIIANCYGFCLAHNHPSGDATPSEADRALTRRMREAADLMQIHLYDHVIMGRHKSPQEAHGNTKPSYFSFKEHGLL
jgi:DNA repair protein RadC